MTIFLQTLVTAAADASLLVMLSIGLTLLFGVVNFINLAQGDLMTLAAYVGVSSVTIGLTLSVSLINMAIILGVVAIVFYYFVIRKTIGHSQETQLLVTFGASYFIQGMIIIIWGADPVAIPYAGVAYQISGVTITSTVIRNISIAGVTILALWFVLSFTALGREIRATSQDRIGAELIGINSKKIYIVVVVAAFVLAAVGGLILLTTSNVTPVSGFNLILNAFAVVIAGGLGSVWGTVIASMFMGLAMELVATYIDGAYTALVPFLVIICVLLVRPDGLFGSRITER